MGINVWLDIISAVGTLGAVIVSLFLSGKETRNKRKEEIEVKNKLKHAITLSLNNIVNQLDKYSKIMDKAMLEFPKDQTQHQLTIKPVDQDAFVISGDAYYAVTRELLKNRNRDYGYIVSQLDVLRKIELNMLSTDLIVIYHSSYTAVANLEKWLYSVHNNAEISTDIRLNTIITNLDYYLNPIKKILNDLE